MRYLLIVALMAAGLAMFLSFWGNGPGAPVSGAAPELLALAVPESVTPAERVSIFGGLRLPTGSFEIGTYACQGGTCNRALWREVEGPGDVWGGFGSVAFEVAGAPATLELRLFQADGLNDRVVATWRKSVSVVSADPEADNPEGRSSVRAER